MDKKELLKEIQLFVLDMDGTFYLGDRMIDGALDFLAKVKETGKEYLFFTNNSSKSREDYVEKLGRMHCRITGEQIMTSGDVTAAYLKARYSEQTVYLLGTPELKKSFCRAGIRLTEDRPDIVVAGFDKTLTYERLERACTYVREGALFLATHPDINCPTEEGFIPDCGAICAAISLSAGKQPKYLGKPCAETVDMILETTGYSRKRVAFVGDRLYTDVAVGVKNGAKGILVLTGETKAEDIEGSRIQPDAVFDSLKDMVQYI